MIPQNSLAGEVVVRGLHNLNFMSNKIVKEVAQCARESDGASEFRAVGSTYGKFRIWVDMLNNNRTHPR